MEKESQCKEQRLEETPVPPKPASVAKVRYEWIDNARIVAALLIIYVHVYMFFPDEPLVNSQAAFNLTKGMTLSGRVPFFLVLAGYFLGRRITWHKACDRAFWLLVPFFIWNSLIFIIYHWDSLSWGCIAEIPSMLGLGSIFLREIHIFGLPECVPAIGVTWFLRDIIVLSLMSPLLVRFKPIIVVGLIIMISYGRFGALPATTVMLSTGTCFYYMLGICLSNYRIDDAYRIFNKSFTPIFVLGLLASTAFCLIRAWQGKGEFAPTVVGALFGAMLIAYSGVLVEKHLPRFSKWLAPCGPACFLVFVLHQPLLHAVAPYIPKWISGTMMVWLLPLPTCAVIIAIFLLMKKYTPWLMPYLGHMKVAKNMPGC